MLSTKIKQIDLNQQEIVRYIINGLIATTIHFSILFFNIEIVEMTSAGLANFIAAFFGIISSFVGNKYYVYKNKAGNIINHMIKFFFLYITIAILHGLILYIWTDIYSFNWSIGFIIATGVQMTFSYIGNKIWVFNNEN